MRLVLADDSVLIREGLARLLDDSAGCEVVGTAVDVLVLSQYLESAFATRLISEMPEGVGYLRKDLSLARRQGIERPRGAGSA